MNKTTLQPKPSQLRCYRCGSPDIHVVCHHCGRPMCRKHGPVRPKLWLLKENREFEGLTLGREPLKQTEGAHCHECVHSRWNYKRLLLYPGLVVFAFGLALSIFTGLVLYACLQEACSRSGLFDILNWLGNGWLLMNTGLSMSALGWYASRDWIVSKALHFRPPALPLGPSIHRLHVLEQWTFAQTWMGHDFHVEPQSAVGQGHLLWQWSYLDQQRLQEYRHKYRISKPEDIEYSAGHFWLVGAPAIRFVPSATWINIKPWNANLLQWRGRASDLPFGTEEIAPRPQNQDILFEYQIRPELRMDHATLWPGGPLRLVLRVEECADRYRLRFEVQFQREYFLHLQPEAWLRIQMLNVEVDASRFGRPQTRTGMKHKAEDGTHTLVTWEDLPVRAAQVATLLPWELVLHKPPAGTRAEITGQLQVYVPALISGLERVQYLNALGYSVATPFDGSTVLHLDFQVDLASLAVPCAHAEPCVWTCDFGREPDHDLYQQLLKALICGPAASEHCAPREGWQVHHVDAEPPRLMESDATHHRWYWEIWGRRYFDTLPVEFHMVLHGDQIGHLEVTVHGVVFDERSQQAVEQTMREIQIAVQEVLRDFCRVLTAENPCQSS